MKITPQQYAQSLYESVRGKTKGEVSVLLENFARIVILNKDANKVDKIAEAFSKIWNASEGIVEADVIIAREMSGHDLNVIKDFIKDRTGAKDVKIEMTVDSDILGGAIMEYDGKILDGSLRTSLENLKISMNK